jgi:hypothetical protein
MRFRAAAAFVAAAVCIPACVLADPGDIAFDQVQRTYIGTTPPPFGTYDALKATFETLGPSVDFPPIPGSVTPAGPGGTAGSGGPIGSLARMREGIAYHYSFLGPLARVDDVAAQKATIVRHDTNEVDYVDFAAKTYVAITGDAAKALLDANVVQQMKKLLSALPGGTTPPGTVGFKITETDSEIEPTAIDGIPSVGHEEKISLETTNASAGCPTLSIAADQTYYVDPARAERIVLSGSDMDLKTLIAGMQRPGGCAITLDGDAPKRNPLHDHLALYSRNIVSISLPGLATPLTVASIMQRAHVRALGPADAALFVIPAGFTALTPPTPSPAPAPAPTK